MTDALPRQMEVLLAGERLRVRPLTRGEAGFWQKLVPGGPGWEDETLAFVARHARPGVVFLDIGAWIGPMSLLAAKRGARVIALEPDPVARAAYEENMGLNGLTAELLPAALHASGNGLTLYGGSKGLGASVTSALGYHRGEPVHVPTVTPEEALDRAGAGPAFMKVDIEGHEYALARQLAGLRGALAGGAGAVLHLSLHPRQLLKARQRRLGPFAAPGVRRRTRELLAAFAPAPMRMEGSETPLDAAALDARLGVRFGKIRNFSVVIGEDAPE